MDKNDDSEPIPRCMVVDDNSEIVEIIEAYLTKLGAKDTVHFNSANGVLETLLSEQEKGDPFKVLILDCNIPGMKGPELLKKIKENSEVNNLFTLIMTGEPETFTANTCLEIGANDFVAKPFTKNVFDVKAKSLFKLSSVDNLNFCPIRSSTLQVDKTINFDVFMPHCGQYRILIKSGALITQDQKGLLVDHKMKKLFILSTDETKYQEYLGSKLTSILSSKDNTSDIKAEAILDYNSLVLKEVYQNLDEVNISRLQTLVTGVQDFARPLEKKAIKALLKYNDQSNIYAHSLRVATICLLILNKISTLKRENNNKHDNLLRPFNSTFNANTKTVAFVTEAALLHDIGKVMNLNQKADEDTNGLHAHWGRDFVESCEYLHKTTSLVIGEHEELCNGKGGPLGLAKHQTHLFSQLVSIASKVDHLLTEEQFSAKEIFNYFDKNDGLYFIHYVKILKMAL